ncbi:MAG: cell wall-binding repeat-containing protein [Actinomycetota bacterium]|nr:cell wall-binding repeat-containing protein [Actinomycetota bacterium]
MRYRTHRLRRLAAAVALGVGMVGGMIGVAAGTAGATTSTAVAGSFKSPNGTTTTIPAGTTKNQVIGTLVLTVARTVTKTKFLTQVVTLTVKDTTGHIGSYTAFTKVNSTGRLVPSVVGPGAVTATSCAVATKTVVHFTTTATGYLKITCKIAKTAGTITSHGKTATAVFTWHTLRVESITGQGKVNVAVADTTGYGTSPTHVTYSFTPTAATAAVYGVAAPTAPFKVLLKNDTNRPTPPAGLGQVGAPAGNWTLTLSSGALTKTHKTTPTYNPDPTARGVLTTGHVKITIEPHTGKSVCVTTKTVAFDGLPKVAVASVTGTTVVATKIKVTDALSGNNGCTGFFAPNVLTVDFTTTVHFTKATATIVISITTVKYSVAPKTATGTVTVSDVFFRSSSTLSGVTATATQTQGLTITSTNAIVSAADVVVKTLKTIAPTGYDQPIGTVSVVEWAPGSVPKGYVCLTVLGSTRDTTGTGIRGDSVVGTLHKATGWSTATFPPAASNTVHFNTSSAPTVKVTSGNGAVGTAAFVTSGVAALTLEFQVTAASSVASTYTVSGLSVNANTRTTQRPLVTAYYSASATCKAASGKPTDHVAVLFTTGKKISQEIYGVTAAATAVQELEHAFPATGVTYENTTCPKLTETVPEGATSFLARTERPVILATSKTYTDSLASQYLAGTLTTGTLLTSPTALTPVTRTALRVEGISHVYVMGGPLAIDTTVVNAIETMPVYRCGGNGLARNHLNQTGTIQVTRIGGPTLYATAAMIAETPPVSEVAGLKLPAAYAGGPTKHGLYNDTTGIGSTNVASGGALATAILANGQEFQDAEAASALAYNTEVPVLLTMPTKLVTQAHTALVALHIRQVIVMGGTLAITNTVVKAVEAMTVTGHPVSVLRVAGKDYTDTAVQLAKMELNDTMTAGRGWDPTSLLIARGNGFTDGIAGAVVERYITRVTSSHEPAPMLLTENQTTVGTYLTTFLKTAGKGYDTATPPHTISHLVVLGGPLAVTPTIIAQMQADL